MYDIGMSTLARLLVFSLVFLGSPALHRVTVTTADTARSFNRLILPLAADGRKVSLLMIALNAAP